MTSDAATGERERTPRALVWLISIALVAAVFLAFSPALTARFVNWDDPSNLEDLRAHRGELWHFWYATGAIDPYQPLAWWSLMLDARMYGLAPGEDAPQAGLFHASAVAIHALAAVAFFFLARRLLGIAVASAPPRALTIASALAACVFAIHPLRVESVVWITERRDVLSGLFYVLTATLWLRALPTGPAQIASKRAALGCAVASFATAALFFASVARPDHDPLHWRGLGPAGLIASGLALVASIAFGARASGRVGPSATWYALAVACFFLALFSKALTVVLPVLLLVLDAWPLKRARRDALLALIVEKLPLFALAAVAGSLAQWAQRRAGETLIGWEQHTASERLAQTFYGLAFYPRQTLAPHGLLPVYELPDDLRWSEPHYWVAALAVVALTLAVLALRKRWPAVLAAWIAFGLAIAPVIGITQAGPQIVADRYSYLSCMPFALLAAGAWLVWRTSSPRARAPATAVAVLAVVALAAATRAQTATWRDSETLWKRASEVAPEQAIAYSMLATAISDRAEVLPDAAERRRILLEVDALFRRSLELDATPLPARWRNFGTNLLRLDRAQEALDPLSRYVALKPKDADGQANYGVALRMVGRASEGVEHLRLAVELDPRNAKNWTQLAQTLEELGDRTGAIAAYEQVARLWPRHEPTRRKLAELRGG